MLPCLKHALDLINDSKVDIKSAHEKIQSNDTACNLGTVSRNEAHHHHHHHHHTHNQEHKSELTG